MPDQKMAKDASARIQSTADRNLSSSTNSSGFAPRAQSTADKTAYQASAGAGNSSGSKGGSGQQSGQTQSWKK
ncbi:hypothetical protein MMC20_001951 [Loxospora ochrophaea]|nr:hypothetical protein [Loxospora ochrophaea]